jgi:hypothetical protein
MLARNSLHVMALLLACGTLAGAGCCKQRVGARAFVGHKSPEECRRLMNENEPPVSITCPGEEVTICWLAGGDDVDSVKLDVSPDPENVSGSGLPTMNAVYIHPKEDTTIKITTDCAGTTKHVMVIDKPKPATFDAAWDGQCSALSYDLPAAFVSPNVRTTDVTANWTPAVATETGAPGMCTFPPFLNGGHDLFFFSILKPFEKTPFSSAQPAVGQWAYVLSAKCPGRVRCAADTREPFEMTLVCPN